MRRLMVLTCAAFAIATWAAPSPRTASGQQPNDKGWVQLFNGKDLTGWVVEGPGQYKDPSGQVQPMWTVADGVLHCAGKAFGFLRYDRQRFSDFTLHVEYQMSAKGNSGIGIRTIPYDPKRSRATRPSFAAYEVQLLDDAGKEPTKHSSGSLYRYVAPVVNPVKPDGHF